MGRPISKKCKHCCMLSIEEAKALHGESGDNCWNPSTCHRRRSHYRHRDDINRTRRRVRRNAKKVPLPSNPTTSSYQTLTIDPVADSQPCAAVLVLYRQTKQSPVHAIAVEIWRGAEKIGEVSPVHCMGMRGNQVTQHIQTILTAIKEQFGITRFEDVIKEKKVEECPIKDCPITGGRLFDDG